MDSKFDGFEMNLQFDQTFDLASSFLSPAHQTDYMLENTPK